MASESGSNKSGKNTRKKKPAAPEKKGQKGARKRSPSTAETSAESKKDSGQNSYTPVPRGGRKKQSAAQGQKKPKTAEKKTVPKAGRRPAAKADHYTESVHNTGRQGNENDPDEYLKKLRKDQGYMPIGDHLEALRWHLIRSIISVAVFSIVAFILYDFIYAVIIGPLLPVIENAESEHNLTVKVITTRLPELFIFQFKVTVYAGLILAIPFILFELWRFILPALDKTVRRVSNAVLAVSVILFWAGAGFARYLIWPIVVTYLITEWLPPDLSGQSGQVLRPEVHLTLSDYLSFFFAFHFAFGVAFQLPVVSFLLALTGILTTGFFLSTWRIAIVVIAFTSAILTPPDIVSMGAMMAPLTVLYIISGFIVFLVDRMRERKRLSE